MLLILLWVLTEQFTWTVTSLPVFIQNILNCVLKTNEAFTGSERHGGVENDGKSFWGGVSL